MYLLGLFYKISEPQSLAEELYKIYADIIKENYGDSFTPVQANAYNFINNNRFFPFLPQLVLENLTYLDI